MEDEEYSTLCVGRDVAEEDEAEARLMQTCPSPLYRGEDQDDVAEEEMRNGMGLMAHKECYYGAIAATREEQLRHQHACPRELLLSEDNMIFKLEM